MLLIGCSLVLAALIWAVLARHFAPLSNSSRQTFDAIIVLGTPADSDGNPTPEMLDRVTEGVQEYERGVAPHMMLTGGAAHNGFVEAEVMARVAEAQGVPASVISEEKQARDTLQNACYSERILNSHGWHSVEVVSSASHLSRAAMIFSHLPDERLRWRMHAAQNNLTPGYYSRGAAVLEVLKTVRYLLWAQWTERCSP